MELCPATLHRALVVKNNNCANVAKLAKEEKAAAAKKAKEDKAAAAKLAKEEKAAAAKK